MTTSARPFLANTDKAWFDFLAARSTDGVVDEVNFWSPRATRPMKRMAPGEPVFFRLKAPQSAIAGYGFFAAFRVLDLELAWDLFGEKNGDQNKLRFLLRIGGYRGLDLLDPRTPRAPLGCTILREAVFWPRERWLSWGEERGWAKNIVQGSTENDPARAEMLLATIAGSPPEELSAPSFQLVEADHRRIEIARQVVREGQGAFKARLLTAYDGRCAITGEHTEPVLDAAHIQPYLGPRSNHVQNGLLLTKEFHVLFDRGYVTVTPEHIVRVSPRLRAEWQNGRRYYPHDGVELKQLPRDPRLQPSPDALAWHGKHVFKKVG